MQENMKTKFDYRKLSRSYEIKTIVNVMMGERVLTCNKEELK